MTHYDSGRRFEWKAIADTAANGYVTMRAAGSKGKAKVDYTAIKPGQQLFVQCKSDGDLSPAEWDRIYEVAGWVGAIPLLATNGPRGRGVTYIRLLGPKRPGLHMKNQPCAVFHLDEIAAETALNATLRPSVPSGVVPDTLKTVKTAGGA